MAPEQVSIGDIEDGVDDNVADPGDGVADGSC